ncbi:MAG TPA: hypothetical protein VFE13_09495 [Caulobacteraceae bacterium]|jgi:hypothetical protein|nr:hypothetical protein [Caulobacteraceae bacterium]
MSAETARSTPRSQGRTAALLLLALAAAPAAWALQLLAGYGLSSWACFPHDAPLRQTPPPGWGAERPMLLAVNLVCLALCLAALAIAARLRPRGIAPAALDVRMARMRFLAHCGILACLGFAGAILFNTANILMVPACWSIPP